MSMIEPNNPEINVDELMEAVRREVAQRQTPVVATHSPLNDAASTVSQLTADVEKVYALVLATHAKAHPRTQLPDKLDRFPFNTRLFQRLSLKLLEVLFRDQRIVNFSIIQALAESLDLNRKLVKQVAELQHQLQQTHAQHEALVATVTHLEQRLETTSEATKAEFQRVDGASASLTERVEQIVNDHHRDTHTLKGQLTQYQQIVTQFLDVVQPLLPQETVERFRQQAVNAEIVDRFYAVFEDRFRGSYQDVADRLKIYLPWIGEAGVGKYESPVLDIGCGRGEWLELLAQSGYFGQGIDLNHYSVNQCQAKGLNVVVAEAVTYLTSLSSDSVGAITAFHVIEHLPFPTLLEFLHQARRVIKPGGLLILETPNPQNVLVGTASFYMDPTHLKPLPSPLTHFVVEQAGFNPVKVLHLHPYEDSYKLEGSPVADKFNDYFYGPQDYAVIGYK